MLWADSCVLFIKGRHVVHAELDIYSPLLLLWLLLFLTLIHDRQTPTRNTETEGRMMLMILVLSLPPSGHSGYESP